LNTPHPAIERCESIVRPRADRTRTIAGWTKLVLGGTPPALVALTMALTSAAQQRENQLRAGRTRVSSTRPPLPAPRR
jgi:hypothetical protein